MRQSTWYTYRTAAQRVKRSTRTIKRWHAAGMPMSWQTIEGQRARVVSEEELLSWFRRSLQNNPVHQQRMRKLLAGTPDQ